MGQVSLYFSDDLEKALKKKASQERKSASAYVASLVRKDIADNGRPISEEFLALFGTCPEFPLFDDEADLPPRAIPKFSGKKTDSNGKKR